MKGYRTVIWNVIMPVLVLFRVWYPDVVIPSDAEVMGQLDSVLAGLTGLWALGNLILRTITNTQIFKKS